MALETNYFRLFDLQQQFSINESALDTAWKTVQLQVHPDRFAGNPIQQRQAVQWSAYVNEAYQTLKKPLLRARYLCELEGFSLNLETNTQMDPHFLMQQIEWREALEENTDKEYATIARQKVKKAVEEALENVQQQVKEALSQQPLPESVTHRLREWMFLEKFLQEV